MPSTQDSLPSPQDAHVLLARSASLAGRPGIVLLDEDLPTLDQAAGTRTRSHALIEALERADRLHHVRRGVYALVDATGGVPIGVLDLVDALTPVPYLVTGGRALQFHELTDQHFRRIHVLSDRQQRSWSWRGDEVRYVRTDKSFRGAAVRSRKTRARIAAPARAIADSLAHPRWGVTLTQVVEALDLALAGRPNFADTLAIEVARQDNHALARRLGLLVSRIAGTDEARPFLPLLGDSKAPTLLEAGTHIPGPIDPTWQVRVNVDLERLFQHRNVG